MLSSREVQQALRATRVVPLTTANPHGPIGLQQLAAEVAGIRRERDGALREIGRPRDRLAEVVKPEAIAAWLETPNPAFDGLKPVEVIERGELDELLQMVFYLESAVAR